MRDFAVMLEAEYPSGGVRIMMRKLTTASPLTVWPARLLPPWLGLMEMASKARGLASGAGAAVGWENAQGAAMATSAAARSKRVRARAMRAIVIRKASRSGID